MNLQFPQTMGWIFKADDAKLFSTGIQIKFSRVLSSQQLLLPSSTSNWCPKTVTSEAQKSHKHPPSTVDLEVFLECLIMILWYWWYCGSCTSLKVLEQLRTHKSTPGKCSQGFVCTSFPLELRVHYWQHILTAILSCNPIFANTWISNS